MNNIDSQYYSRGYRFICGVDEAGRGAWAGPIVAAAVILPHHHTLPVDDSKKLSEQKREQLYSKIIHTATAWSIVALTQIEIDELGVHQANLNALTIAMSQLYFQPELALVDGFNITHKTIPTEKIIGGDGKSASIAAASILAKVTRDRLMRRLDRWLPQYHFGQHKGYGTKLHQDALHQYGVSYVHRKSFAPIQRCAV